MSMREFCGPTYKYLLAMQISSEYGFFETALCISVAMLDSEVIMVYDLSR